MRKAIVAVFVMGLLAVSAPAMAQPTGVTPGSLDPLGLVTSGLVLPYVGPDGVIGSAGSLSFLEVAAPIADVRFHAFFYDTTCARQGDSIGIQLTTNDLELIRLDNLGGGIPKTGLMTAAGVDQSGFLLNPIPFPGAVHARVFWADASANRLRILEPIALSTFDNDRNTDFATQPSSGVWNPLRTGATFFAPLDTVTGFKTTIYFICPTTNIAGAHGSTTSTSRAFGTDLFPELVPNASSGVTPLRVRVYDDDERFLRDVNTNCSCLTAREVAADISAVYADAAQAPFGTYSEVEGTTTSAVPAVCSTAQVVPLATPGVKNSGNPCPLAGANFCAFTEAGQPTCQFTVVTPATNQGGPFAFTGYRAIDVGSFDAWGRLSNGNKCDIQGAQVPPSFDSCTQPSINNR